MKRTSYHDFLYNRLKKNIGGMRDDLAELCVELTAEGAETLRMSASHKALIKLNEDLDKFWSRHAGY